MNSQGRGTPDAGIGVAEFNFGGFRVLVDETDAAFVRSHWWSITGKKSRTPYAITAINGKTTSMHRLIMGVSARQKVDHINNDSLDNRRSNLRPCSPSQNTWNARKCKSSTSRFKGVYKVGKRKNSFEVELVRGGTRYQLGRFFDEVAAAICWDIATVALSGEFARPNFSIVEAAIVHPDSFKIAAARCIAKGIAIPESVAA